MDLFRTSAFDDRVHDLMQEWHVPGLAIALVHNNETASKGYGQASLDPPKPCTTETIFDIASSSKSLTAGAVALLVEDNENYPNVQWDTPMCELLPEDFIMSDESYTRDITVEDILSHRTGLPAYDETYFGPQAAVPDTPKSVTRNLRNLAVSSSIRSKFMYCNMMFTVATHLVETVTGKTFARFLHDRIFKPLGMDTTHLQPDAAIAAGLGDQIATPHIWKKESNEYKMLPLIQEPEAQGAGGIFTSVDDHIKWVKALVNQEPPVTNTVYEGLVKSRGTWDPEARDQDREPRTSWTVAGAGLEVRYYRGHQIVSHDGLNYGFGSVHWLVPDCKFGGSIFGNSDSATDLAPVIARILIDEVLGIPQDKRPNWSRQRQGTNNLQDKEEEEDAQILRKKLCAPDLDPQPQEIELGRYTGNYWNSGYRGMHLQVKDDKLFIDASDRSMGFYLHFEHMRDQTKYAVHMTDFLEGGDQLRKGEFVFEGGNVVKMGVKLEEDLDDLIWFDKVSKAGSSSTQQEF